jgi:transposase
MEMSVQPRVQTLNFQDYVSRLTTNFENRYNLLRCEMIEHKTKSHYWETQFNRAKERESALRTEVEDLKAKLRKRDQQLFGKKSEKFTSSLDRAPSDSGVAKQKKKRGQQQGTEGHGQRNYSHLITLEEEVSFAEGDGFCRCCGLPYDEFGEKESKILEVVHVRPYCRNIRRKQYKRRCSCPENPDPQIVSPPITERLIPKSRLGISIWSMLLLNKYKYHQPLNRYLNQLAGNGLELPPGTVVDGLQKLLPLLSPIYDGIVQKSISANHWHADETGWKVFEKIEGKKNNRWFMWVFKNAETAVFKIGQTRSSKELLNYFGEDHAGGTLNVDRYSAYKVIAKSDLFILAFCWAHVRRDFLEHAKSLPHQESWALKWVDKIGNLYHINNQRISCPEKSALFQTHDASLKKAVLEMQSLLDVQREDQSLLPSAKKLLISLKKHWDGLTVFVDRPEIPMDNNSAERALRPGVLGRKNYSGSGAVWSSELTAVMYSLFETLKIWKLNEHAWLLNYFYECALIGGKPPDTVEKYLPWNMTEGQRVLLSEPPPHQNLE